MFCHPERSRLPSRSPATAGRKLEGISGIFIADLLRTYSLCRADRIVCFTNNRRIASGKSILKLLANAFTDSAAQYRFRWNTCDACQRTGVQLAMYGIDSRVAGC